MEKDAKVRFAVVGLGHIAQVAVLPGFRHAKHAELTALVSGDPKKRAELAKEYAPAKAFDYGAYDEVLGAVDAVYIALPNHLHREYAVRAAKRGIHVLCEKPLAVDEEECLAMIDAADANGVKLMTAYRLHLDPANLEAAARIRKGDLGRPRVFSSSFTQQVVAGNVRLMPVAQGGGPVYDMGIYCINAVRYLFADEPYEIHAMAASREDERYRDSPEMVAVTMRFPDERLATFVCSFGAADSSHYEVLGDRGRLVMQPAYEYAEGLRMRVEIRDEKPREQGFDKHDQFGAELEYFARCVLEDTPVEPDGIEGLADVHIIRAIHQSIREQKPVSIVPVRPRRRPDEGQAIVMPGVKPPDSVNAKSPSGE